MKIIQSSNNIINLYNDENIFDWYSKFSNNRIIRDRFGLDLNKYSPWHISDKVDIIPDGNVSTSIETALHEEISSICKLKKNVYIMWSGGVDSTAIICSFIQNGYSKTNIHILYTEDSIKEYPQFFNYLQKNSFNMILFDYSSLFELIKNVIQSDDILINGVHGDKLYEGLFPESYENIHWKQFVLENSGKQYIPIFEHILKSFDFNPTTTADFFWMMDFNFRWGETLTLPFVKNVILPFSSDTFQNICVNRMKTFHSYGVKESSNPSLYKPELKKIIFDVTKDTDYTNSKQKIRSFKNIKGFNKTSYKYNIYLWCESGVIVETAINSYEKMKFLKYWRKDQYNNIDWI